MSTLTNQSRRVFETLRQGGSVPVSSLSQACEEAGIAVRAREERHVVILGSGSFTTSVSLTRKTVRSNRDLKALATSALTQQ